MGDDKPKAPALDVPAGLRIPPGSGDYARTLTLVTRYRRGELDFEDLSRCLGALNLPPHRLGDTYLTISPPPPPPGMTWDVRMMPRDWEGNWGEVMQVHLLGLLTPDEYIRLHAALHPDCVAYR